MSDYYALSETHESDLDKKLVEWLDGVCRFRLR